MCTHYTLPTSRVANLRLLDLLFGAGSQMSAHRHDVGL